MAATGILGSEVAQWVAAASVNAFTVVFALLAAAPFVAYAIGATSRLASLLGGPLLLALPIVAYGDTYFGGPAGASFAFATVPIMNVGVYGLVLLVDAVASTRESRAGTTLRRNAGGDGVLRGFRDFILRGNVVELAVAVAIGAAFTAVVSAFGTAFINPLIALIVGDAGSTASFTAGGQEFPYGALITALVTFVLTAAVIYFLVVVPANRLMERFKTEPEPVATTTSCTECLSKIPIGARRCAFCTAQQTP